MKQEILYFQSLKKFKSLKTLTQNKQRKLTLIQSEIYLKILFMVNHFRNTLKKKLKINQWFQINNIKLLMLIKKMIQGNPEICSALYLNPNGTIKGCLLYTSPSPRDRQKSRMPSSA
eukprot:TRINITY_DN10845_c0_g1_i1.p3 TRINITY_DN10845_c0_g1~~TRINITY_DN10845_c0_g1_i1.p3  ORF type:complete len:117 (-),score=19.87 TRINITY_DN10845_c0_g1_i1:15-365(-)